MTCPNYPTCRCETDCSSAEASVPSKAIVWIAGGIGLGALLLLARPADAHDALPTAAQPEGWSYPYSCCSGMDCRAVADKAVSERPDGYHVPSGEVVPMTDVRVKESPDGAFHWCTVAGTDEGRTICLFVPPRSY